MRVHVNYISPDTVPVREISISSTEEDNAADSFSASPIIVKVWCHSFLNKQFYNCLLIAYVTSFTPEIETRHWSLSERQKRFSCFICDDSLGQWRIWVRVYWYLFFGIPNVRHTRWYRLQLWFAAYIEKQRPRSNNGVYHGVTIRYPFYACLF